MRSKKILPILLSAFSCLPYTSALESKQKQAVVGSTDKNGDAKTMNPLISGGIGFVTGAGIAGLSAGFGVRHFKNKEIDEEKQALKQENEDLKAKWQSIRDILLTKPVDKQCTDEEFLEVAKEFKKHIDNLKKAAEFYTVTILGNLKKGKELFRDPDDPLKELPTSITMLFKPGATYKNLTDEGNTYLKYYALSTSAILDFIFSGGNPSSSILDNYKITPEHLANPPLKLQF